MYPSKGIPLGLLDIVMVDWIINICPSINEVSSIFAKSKQLYLCPFAFSRCRWMSANQYVRTSRSAYIFLPGCVAEVWIPLTCNEKKNTKLKPFVSVTNFLPPLHVERLACTTPNINLNYQGGERNKIMTTNHPHDTIKNNTSSTSTNRRSRSTRPTTTTTRNSGHRVLLSPFLSSLDSNALYAQSNTTTATPTVALTTSFSCMSREDSILQILEEVHELLLDTD